MKNKSLGKLILGKLGKKQQARYLFTTIFLFLAFLTISLVKYPEDYDVYKNQISHLGSHELNPIGHIFFDISMIFFGALIFPHMLYLFREHFKFMKKTSILALLSAACMCSCLILLPFFPVDNWDPHIRVAGAIFIGFMVFSTCLGYVWVVKMRKKLNASQNFNLALLNGGILVIIIFFILNLTTLWEWIYFITMLIYITFIFFFLPDNGN